MPKVKSNKPKRNVWSDPSPYGTYEGDPGKPEQWKFAFEYMAYAREKAEEILKTVVLTPYQILNVSENATQEEIKSAWKRLVLIHHPDKGGDRETFEQVMAAYSILTI